jgi:hypothetical protein
VIRDDPFRAGVGAVEALVIRDDQMGRSEPLETGA